MNYARSSRRSFRASLRRAATTRAIALSCAMPQRSADGAMDEVGILYTHQ